MRISKEIPIIIARYICREIYLCLLAITLILLAIFITNQFAHFLNLAAKGSISIGLAVKLVGFQIPVLLTYLLPLAFYLSILIAFGRLYIDHEMTVMTVCGISLFRQVRIVLGFGCLVAAVSAWLTLWLVPVLQHDAYSMRNAFANQFKIQTLVPKRFNHFGKSVFYLNKMSHHNNTAHDVFLAMRSKQDSVLKPSQWDITVAQSAHSQTVPYDTGKFIVATAGERYSGVPGQLNFQSYHFQGNGINVLRTISSDTAVHHVPHKKQILGMSTLALWKIHATDPLANAELQLRLAIPISVLIVSLLGVGLCKVDPRRGKFAQLIPAILLYVFYADMIFVSRAWLQRGLVPEGLGMWWIHGVMLLVALLLLARHVGWQRIKLTFKPSVTKPCIS